MKKRTAIAAVLGVLILFQSLLCVNAYGANIAEKTSFEYQVSKVESGSTPGNILVQLYCETDPDELVTTLGATFVIKTDYVDVVNKKGEVTTENYKTDVTSLGSGSTVAAAKLASGEALSSVKSLSIASYNEANRELYVFLCGMALSGMQISDKSPVISVYLQTKGDGKIPANAIRLMEQSEYGTACTSKALFVNEISSKKEIGKGTSSCSLNVDEALIEPVKEPETTTAKPETTTTATPSQSTTTAKSTSQSATTAQATTKAISQMSEKEIEKELEIRIEAKQKLHPTESQKDTPAYKAYEKAVELAKEVLSKKEATPEQKAQALEAVREAEEALKAEIPALAEQLDAAESRLSMVGSTAHMWWFVGGGIVILIAAVIMVLIFNKKSKEENE